MSYTYQGMARMMMIKSRLQQQLLLGFAVHPEAVHSACKSRCTPSVVFIGDRRFVLEVVPNTF